VGVAELYETGAFRVFDNTALERNGAQFIGLAAAWSHGVPPGSEKSDAPPRGF
jgi:hypothetical protein